jgi:hypothetical protein
MLAGPWLVSARQPSPVVRVFCLGRVGPRNAARVRLSRQLDVVWQRTCIWTTHVVWGTEHEGGEGRSQYGGGSEGR